jgi:molecular chaperone GrpE
MNETPEPTDTAAAGIPTDPVIVEIEDLRLQLEQAQSQLEQAQAQAAAAKDTQLRAVAELDNVRRRIEREAANSLKFANEKLLGELLSVCDSLELGLKAAAGEAQGSSPGPAQAVAAGLQLTYRQLMAVLEKYGVRVVDPSGQPFNPDLHQAMTMAESAEVPANHVLSVMQKGYQLHERLLRPAMVVVARAPVAADS